MHTLSAGIWQRRTILKDKAKLIDFQAQAQAQMYYITNYAFYSNKKETNISQFLA